MNHCENCGCPLNHGICSNCQEEAYILGHQAEYIDFQLSDQFIERAKDREAEIKRNRKKIRDQNNKSQ